MSEMIMLEDGNMDLFWECSNCKNVFKDFDGFENKNTVCKNCNEKVEEFVSLFDDDGEYA